MDEQTERDLMKITDYIYKIYELMKDIDNPMMKLSIVNTIFINEITQHYDEDYLKKHIDVITQEIGKNILEACAIAKVEKFYSN